jgi:hypothetical protein
MQPRLLNGTPNLIKSILFLYCTMDTEEQSDFHGDPQECECVNKGGTYTITPVMHIF